MGITDGTFVCALCGEWMTGCSLCGEAQLVDRREHLHNESVSNQKAEQELRAQERSIRAAKDRQYF